MEKVQKLIEAGASLSGAVREAIRPRSIASFAEDYGLSRQNLQGALGGRRTVGDAEVAALIDALGGTVPAWRQLFAEAAYHRTLHGTAA